MAKTDSSHKPQSSGTKLRANPANQGFFALVGKQ
jgi:hypothetical protein